MGNKVRPTSFRLGINENWNARWFQGKSYRDMLREDETIRHVINEKIGTAGISKIEIERTGKQSRVFIKAARPGLIIGRGGQGITDLSRAIDSALVKLHKGEPKYKPLAISLNVEELKRSEISSANVGQNIAWDL